MKYFLLLLCLYLFSFQSQAQQSLSKYNPLTIVQDSTKKLSFSNFLGNGYLPTKYFDFDFKYLIKFNQYEGIRTGVGGVTNSNFSDTYKIKGYSVYGFRDHRFKFNISGGFRIAPKRNTWIYISYTDDLEETGSSVFLTDKRLFQLFEPRLLNIDLFHKHISKSINIEHQIFNKVVAETQFAIRKIDPTYDYTYLMPNGNNFTDYNVTTAKISAQWSPFSTFEYDENSIKETKSGYPNFTLQYTKSFENFFNGDLEFSKLNLRAIQLINYKNDAQSEIILAGGIANGDAPLQFLYHAYPNNVNKEGILERFTVAGINSFETMYFNEFFSDRFATLIIKHKLRPFQISPKFQPQLVLLTKLAIGDMDQIERHQNISFSTLKKGFTESGIEINKLFFGFGFSFAYRYGAYHLPKFEDNIAFKFTFNFTID